MSNVNERSIVISLVGGSSKGTGVRSDYLGNKNIIEAAVTSGLKRFIFVTAIGSGESRHELPDVVKPFLGPIAAEKTKAENVLRETDLDFTIIRPGQLTNDKASEYYVEGVSCPHCHNLHSEERKARFAERQKQIGLAEKRNHTHIGQKFEPRL